MTETSQASEPTTTLYFQNKFPFTRILNGSLTSAGIGLYLLPLSSKWTIFVFLLSIVISAALIVYSDERYRYAFFCLIIVVTSLSLLNYLSVPKTGAIVIAGVLCLLRKHLIPLAIIIYFSASSLLASCAGYLSSSSEAALFPLIAPPLVMAVVFTLFYPKKINWITAHLFLSIAIGMYCEGTSLPSSTAVILVSLPIILLGFRFGFEEKNLKINYKVKVLLLILLIVFSWWNDFPRSSDKIYFLIPNASGEYEDKFLKNYKEIARHIKASYEVISNIDSVEARSTIVVPVVTRKLFDDPQWNTLSTYAKEKELTVLIAGEHTNYKGVAERINKLTKGISINSDLTVPPGNTDEAGHLRSPTLTPFPFDAILNRGASINIQSIFTKVLLSGDGWFADSDLKDPTWVGDFLLNPGEKRGRITLGASYTDEARWVFFGDNSFLLNKAIISDPKPLLSAIHFSTLWPIFISDLLIVIFFISLLFDRYPAVSPKNIGFMCWFLTVVLAYGVAVKQGAKYATADFFKTTDMGESAFDRRNFNNAFVELLGADHIDDIQIVRHKNFISEHKIGTSEKPEIHFGLVDSEIKIGDTRLFNCWRLGNLSLSGGISINDGQSCTVEGDGQVLIGKRNDAAAVKIHADKKTVIIILDPAFLSNGSLNSNNLNWVMDQAKSLSVEPVNAN